MKYLRIINWKKFQHYKDRCPPWIKLHVKILNDRNFMLLADASKCLLMLLWVLSSEEEGLIPYDLDEISFRLRRDSLSLKEFKHLVDKGFLEVVEIVDGEVLADASGCSPETETEAYKEEAEGEYSSEPSEDSDPTIFLFPTNRFNTIKEEVKITASKVAEWAESFPGVDVERELVKIKQWLIDNAPKRKTAKGMFSFVSRWLSKEQDKGPRQSTGAASTTRPTLSRGVEAGVRAMERRANGGR